MREDKENTTLLVDAERLYCLLLTYGQIIQSLEKLSNEQKEGGGDKEKEVNKEAELQRLEKSLQQIKGALAKMGCEKPKEESERIKDMKMELFYREVPQLFKCDGCGAELMRGMNCKPSWRCFDCMDYDLCQECYEKGIHKEHHRGMTLEQYSIPYLVEDIFAEQTVTSALRKSFSYFPNRPCVGERRMKEDGTFENEYVWITQKQMQERTSCLKAGLAGKLGLKKGSFVSILSRSSIDWVVADIAAMFLGVINCPIHDRADDTTIKFIINNAKICTVFCQAHNVNKLLDIITSGECPSLKHIVIMDKKNPNVQYPDHSVFYMEELESFGKTNSHQEEVEILPSDLCTVFFTSGSTGRPKGPLCYVTDREMTLGCIASGGRTGLLSTQENVFEDMEILSPTEVAFTPRVYAVAFNEFQRMWLLKKKEYIDSCGGVIKNPFELDAIRFSCISEVRRHFGSRLMVASVGGAACNPHLKEFLKELLRNVNLEEGYGTTEVASIADERGVIGKSIEWRLEEVPEMGYYPTDTPFPRGELLVKNKELVRTEYFESEQESAASFTSDGYFRTGDVVEVIGNNTIRIIDRRKALFKLSQGEFISPARIEETLSTEPIIRSVYVSCSNTATTEVNAIIAVVVPDEKTLRLEVNRMFPSFACPDSFEELCKTNEARKCVLCHIQAKGIKENMRQYEIPVSVHLSSEEWTEENKMITVSNKVNRPVLRAKFQDIVDELVRKHAEGRDTEGDSNTNGDEDTIKTISDILGVPEEEIKNKGVSEVLQHGGGDSLSAIRLVAVLREKHNITIEASQLYSSPTALSSGPKSQKAGGTNNLGVYKPSGTLASATSTLSKEEVNIIEELINDMERDSTIDLCEGSTPLDPATIKPKEGPVFLTGCTGFIGIHVLYETLRGSDKSKVFCLIRAKDNEEAKRKLQQRAKEEFLFIDNNAFGIHSDELWNRINVVCGDLSKPGLGLSEHDRKTIIDEVSIVIHVGAYVNHVKPYSYLRAANVLGTAEVVKLAYEARVFSLVHVSTISTFADNSLLSFKVASQVGGYVQTKLVGEMIVDALCRKYNIKRCIVRPGMVSWSAKTGGCNKEDWLMRWIIGCSVLGCAPETRDLLMRVVPVDYMARTICHMAIDKNMFGLEVNIINVYRNQSGNHAFEVLANCAQQYIATGGKNPIFRGITKLDKKVSFEVWREYLYQESEMTERRIKEGKTEFEGIPLSLMSQAYSGLMMFTESLPDDAPSTTRKFYPTFEEFPHINDDYYKLLFRSLVSFFP